MEIIIINGSPRKNGATAKLLHAFEKELLTRKDVHTEFIEISGMNIRPCTGCMTCYRKGKCCFDDDAEKLSERIEAADGIIIGSPTYASNISGQLKLFIDRGHFVMEQLLNGKYAVCVNTGVNYGCRDANKVLSDLVRYSGAYLSGSIACNVPFGSDPCDDRMKERIKKLSSGFYSDMISKKTYPVQKAFHGIIFSFGIKPFVDAHKEEYSGVSEKWKRYGAVR